jgi:hypothetical protein
MIATTAFVTAPNLRESVTEGAFSQRIKIAGGFSTAWTNSTLSWSDRVAWPEASVICSLGDLPSLDGCGSPGPGLC